MVQRWKAFWLREARDPADYPKMDCHPNAWILDEIHQLIFGGDYYYSGIVSSYISRLCDTNNITNEELFTFTEKIYAELDDMRRLLGLPDPKEKVTPLDK